jgi:hypothetical protein
LTAIAVLTVIGTSAGASIGIDVERVEQLLEGIFQDVGAILNSFAGGPDDPTNPITNAGTLRQDSERLQAATRKAYSLADELNKLHR